MTNLIVILENPLYDCLLKVAVSFFCGIVLGIERRTRQQFIGLRTLILICVSSCLLMQISLYIATLSQGRGDPGRIAAQVVSGIGFIGAGAILHQGLNIKGLTSAAIIWTAAALGLAIGAGYLVPSVIILVVIILSLVIIEKIEEKVFPTDTIKKLNLVFYNCKIDYELLEKTILESGMIVGNLDISENLKTQELELNYTVKSASNVDIEKLINNISKLRDLEKYSLKIK
ncbi:MAG: MgtC/SapB family protein [Spirochaetaceae bacterium]|nr:MgtC/SapB family protein [Spirochaetaceae bacterium]